MVNPKICVSIVENDLAAVKKVEPLIDLFEVRIDLIGRDWRDIARLLKKPWIACNRRVDEGGKWQGGEAERIREILNAVELGAAIVDIEFNVPGLNSIIKEIKGKADLLLSFHDFEKTPPFLKMREIVDRQIAAGADICKVVTTARKLTDNILMLRIIREFSETKMVSFAMGETGRISRILSPLAGGCFTYASVGEGREAASGQINAVDLRAIYRMLDNGAD